MYLVGVTRNFSCEGFSFVSEDFDIKPQETIEFRIKYPEKNKYVTVLGDIVWKRQVRDRGLAGIKIRDMDSETKREILKYAYDRCVKRRRCHRKYEDQT